MHIKNKDFRRKQDLFHPLTSATGVHKATALRTGVFCTFCSRTSRGIHSPSGLYKWELERKPHPKENTGSPPQQHSNGGESRKVVLREETQTPWQEGMAARAPGNRQGSAPHYGLRNALWPPAIIRITSLSFWRSLCSVWLRWKSLRRDSLKTQKTEATNPQHFLFGFPKYVSF